MEKKPGKQLKIVLLRHLVSKCDGHRDCWAEQWTDWFGFVILRQLYPLAANLARWAKKTSHSHETIIINPKHLSYFNHKYPHPLLFKSLVLMNRIFSKSRFRL